MRGALQERTQKIEKTKIGFSSPQHIHKISHEAKEFPPLAATFVNSWLP